MHCQNEVLSEGLSLGDKQTLDQLHLRAQNAPTSEQQGKARARWDGEYCRIVNENATNLLALRDIQSLPNPSNGAKRHLKRAISKARKALRNTPQQSAPSPLPSVASA